MAAIYMCNVFSCVAMSCVGRMHAKCTYVMLLLMQYMHVVCSTFRFRVSVRFCFSVGNLVEYSPGIVVSGGGGGAQKSQDFIFSYFVRGSMKISRRNPCSPFFSVSYSINRHKII